MLISKTVFVFIKWNIARLLNEIKTFNSDKNDIQRSVNNDNFLTSSSLFILERYMTPYSCIHQI